MDGSPSVHPYAVALVVGWVKAVRRVFSVPPGGFWWRLVALHAPAVGPPASVPGFPVVSLGLWLVPGAEDVCDWPG